MNITLSAVLPPAAGIICVVDDDPSMLKALNRLLSSVGLQAQLFSEPLGFLAYVICNTVALAVLDIFIERPRLRAERGDTGWGDRLFR